MERRQRAIVVRGCSWCMSMLRLLLVLQAGGQQSGRALSGSGVCPERLQPCCVPEPHEEPRVAADPFCGADFLVFLCLGPAPSTNLEHWAVLSMSEGRTLSPLLFPLR
jgi:hypothetical protein